MSRLLRTRVDILTRCGLLQERAQLLLRSLLRSVSDVAVGGQAGPLVGHLLVGRLALPVRRRAPAEVEGPPPLRHRRRQLR